MPEPSVTEETLVAPDGHELALTVHHCARPTAVVACLHGIQSHAGWYGRSGAAFADAGLATVFMDRRGSGRDQVDRGHADGYRTLRGDVLALLDECRRRHPGLPVVLLGISWGGKVALAVLRDRPDAADALVAVAPGWFARVKPTLRERAAVGLSHLLRPRRRIRIPLSDPALFTATPQGRRFIADDPLALRTASARLLMTSVTLGRRIRDAPERLAVPTLLVLAGRDRIIDNDRTRAFFDRFAVSEKTLLEYPEAHHTLEFEPEAEPIFADMIGWIRGAVVRS